MTKTNLANLPYTVVLLDLDGTITDSKELILEALRATFANYDVADTSDEGLNRYIGPPLTESFTEYAGFPPDEVHDRIEEFRSIYLKTLLDTPLFPGMREAIQELSEAGLPLALATSKGQESALNLLDHLELSQYFTVRTGADPKAGRSRKEEVVEAALKALKDKGIDISRAALVGDRKHDVEGAKKNGIDSIVVNWGYGDESEKAAGTYRVESPEKLVEFLTTEKN